MDEDETIDEKHPLTLVNHPPPPPPQSPPSPHPHCHRSTLGAENMNYVNDGEYNGGDEDEDGGGASGGKNSILSSERVSLVTGDYGSSQIGGYSKELDVQEDGYGDGYGGEEEIGTEGEGKTSKFSKFISFFRRMVPVMNYTKIVVLLLVLIVAVGWGAFIPEPSEQDHSGGGFEFYAVTLHRSVLLPMNMKSEPLSVIRMQMQLVQHDNGFNETGLSYHPDQMLDISYRALLHHREDTETKRRVTQAMNYGQHGLVTVFGDVVDSASSFELSNRSLSIRNITSLQDIIIDTPWDLIDEWNPPESQLVLSGLYINISISSDDKDSLSRQQQQQEDTFVPLQIKVTQHNGLFRARIVIAFIILCFVYFLIIFELIDRTVCTMLGAMLTVAAMATVHMKPSIADIVRHVEFHTLLLLFGMMIIVAIFSSTGFFEWVALKACKISRNNIWLLTVILCIFTAISAAMLDNVTTTLLLAPVIVRLSQVMDISPVPILMSTVLLSNVGGNASAVGDPPVVLIVNTPEIKAAGIGFNEILFFMAPGATIMIVVSIAMLRFLYYKEFRSKAKNISADEIRLTKEISIWSGTEKRLSDSINGEVVVKQMIDKHIEQLRTELSDITHTNKLKDSERIMGNIKQLEKDYRIRNYYLFISCAIVLTVVVLLFFTENFFPFMHMPMSTIALFGAVAVLILSNTKEVDYILEKVEWSTLIFFGCLFIIMGGISDLGLMTFIGNQVTAFIGSMPDSIRLPVAITLILWISAIVSGIVDSIPYTTSMIPIVLFLADSLSLPLKPLVFSMAYGTGLGGNASVVASTANIIVVGVAAKAGFPISFIQFSRKGIPVMIVTTIIANIYLLLIHCVFQLGLS